MLRTPQVQKSLSAIAPAWLATAATLLATFLRFYRLTSLTPEAWFDEIWFALRARDLLQQPEFIVFYKTAWGGGNALMVYLTAMVGLFGFTDLSASRYASAALGALAVPLAYACFRELLRGSGLPARRWMAALAALVCAYLLYWVIVARVGTEPSLAPTVALFCVWQMKMARRKMGETRPALGGQAQGLPLQSEAIWSKYRVVNYGLAGLAVGVAQYNGPHARFILPLLALLVMHEWLCASRDLRARLLVGYAVVGVVALLIAAPLIAFFIQNPDWFLARASATTARSPLSDPSLWYPTFYLTLRSFNIVGSFDPLTNYPGLPMFDLVQSIGFLVGHGWALWQLRRSALARDLLLWEAIMIAPTLVTSGAPNFQRMIGVGAPAACLIAIGWVLTLRWFMTTLFVQPLAPVLRLIGGLGLTLGIVLSPVYQAYVLLVQYPALSILPVSFNHAPVQVARDLLARAQAGERVFVSRHPEDGDVAAFEFLLANSPVERLDFRQCLPLSADRATPTTYLVLTDRDHTSMPDLYRDYPGAKVSAALYFEGFGSELEVPAHALGPQPPLAGRANFESGLDFIGYEWSGPSVAAGQSLFMTLWWRVEADQSIDYTSFIHVGTGLNGTPILAQRDGQPCQGLFPTSHWRAGDLIRDSFAITFPPETPPGQYPLAIGWYTYPDFVRLHLTSAEQPLPDDRAIIGEVTVSK